jgi:hypothetical protein
MSNGWSQNTWGTSDFGWGGLTVVSVEVTSVSASGNVGFAGVQESVSVNVSSIAPAFGWGRSTWGSGGWNALSIDGESIAMVGSIGSTFVNAEAVVDSVSGVSGIKFLGDEDLVTNNNLSVTGFGAIANIGIVGVQQRASFNASGQAANANLGSVSVSITATANVTQVSITGSNGNLLVSAAASATPLQVSGTVNAGNTQAIPRVNIVITGFEASANVGALSTVIGKATFNVTGLSSVTGLGNTLVWGEINTNQTPNWDIIKEAA